MKKLALTIIVLVILIILCSCSVIPKEQKGITITSIRIVQDYSELNREFNSEYCSFAIVKSDISGIKDYCEFSFYVERNSEWYIDSDGVRHFHVTGGTTETVDCDISVFNRFLRLINNGNPSVYSGPERDSSGEANYKVVPYLILLEGYDGFGKKASIVYDNTDNIDRIIKRVDELIADNT